ncbi:MAG: aconitase/3-isopropylmalate dehydratase large subunit family protein, partial [bacterium]|nr:aconitase/3-isopropylmalate dehydratase large subunit family protein [bacterium]
AFSTGMGSTDMAAAMATGECWIKVPESMKFVCTGRPGKWVSGKDLILHIIGMIGVDGALYRAMEFAGDTFEYMTMADRFTICNMAIEAGGKNGIVPPDQQTIDYMTGRAKHDFTLYASDPDAAYHSVYDIDVSSLEPMVAFPHLPENVRPVSQAGDVPIDQVVIGSCTNGRIEDLRVAAEVLRGRKVNRKVRLIILPGTQAIYLQAIREGLVEDLVEAGAAFSTPTCGPCLGGHMGVLASGERAIATTNRNFVGRMGHPQSEVYLSNPAVAAASAIAGKIASPDEL